MRQYWPGPSSHRGCWPLIALDPSRSNITDVYAFISPEGLNAVVRGPVLDPFSEPGDGPIYDRFADDALLQHSHHESNEWPNRDSLFPSNSRGRQSRHKPPGLKFPFTILSYGRRRADQHRADQRAQRSDQELHANSSYPVKKNGVPIGTDAQQRRPTSVYALRQATTTRTRGIAQFLATNSNAFPGHGPSPSLDSIPLSRQLHSLIRLERRSLPVPVKMVSMRTQGGIFDLLDARILDHDGEGSQL